MAQTIVAKTGTISANWYEPTAHTIFTQSTGSAAKVILNQLACTFPGSTYPYYPRFSLWISNSSMGGYKHQIGYYAFQQTAKAVGIFPGSKTPMSNGQGSFIPANFVNFSQSYTSLENVSNLVPSITVNSGSSYFPDTFYMNNGDTLYIKGDSYDPNSGLYITGNCYYNFTTIVES